MLAFASFRVVPGFVDRASHSINKLPDLGRCQCLAVARVAASHEFRCSPLSAPDHRHCRMRAVLLARFHEFRCFLRFWWGNLSLVYCQRLSCSFLLRKTVELVDYLSCRLSLFLGVIANEMDDSFYGRLICNLRCKPFALWARLRRCQATCTGFLISRRICLSPARHYTPILVFLAY